MGRIQRILGEPLEHVLTLCGQILVCRIGDDPPPSLSLTPPCVHPRRLRVYIQHVPVYAGTTRTCFNMCAWCRYTRRRVECTHGDVLDGHTGFFSTCHTTTPQHPPRDTTHKTQHNTTQHDSTTTRQHNSTTAHHTTTRPRTTTKDTHTQHNATPPHPHTAHRNQIPVQCILSGQQFL